jgi:molybdopterin synthase sulfur carrier subunit
MKVHVISFGQIKEIIGAEPIELQHVTDTEEVIQQLEKQYPLLSGCRYMVAVDKKITTGRTELPEGTTVALLPPFSGG